MVEERSIWLAAVYLISRHGAGALQEAQKRICEQHVWERRSNWMRVANVTAELLRSPPDKDDTVH